MAFTNPPKITLVADNLVRLSRTDSENEFGLAEGDSGTIGLFEADPAAEVTLPEAFKPRDYVNSLGDTVALQDSIQVWITKTAFDLTTEVPITVVKTGTAPDDFLITLENTIGAEGGGCDFEIYIRFH